MKNTTVSLRNIALCAVLALGLAAPALGQRTTTEIRVEPELNVQGPKAERLKGKGRASRSTHVTLAAPTPGELAQVEVRGKSGRPPQIGFPRPITTLQADDATGRALQWEAVEGGTQVASISVSSPEAAALRFALRIHEVPAEAVFRFFDLAGEERFEVSGAEVLVAIEANRAAGETGPDARTWWSPVLESATAVMEVELPAGASPLRMAVPMVSHLVASVKTGFVVPKAAAACNLDATCQLGAWSQQMNAISRMVFTSGGSTFVCTGTLLADLDPSTTIPYFLTAHHCIGSQTVASSLVNYWFFRSSACNGGNPGAYVQQGGGATRLYSSTTTDVSFLQLNATPPAGTTFAGWKSTPGLSMNAAVTGLHHPTGDLLKISGGNVGAFLSCTAPGSSGQFSCNTSSAASSRFYGVEWSSGVVEGGSSGSALFDSGKYVVGQLYGGGSTCADPQAGDVYGRFDVSFNTALSEWLDAPPPPPPQHQLTATKAGLGSGTITTVPTGISCGSTCSRLYDQGTIVTLTATPSSTSSFAGWSGACSNTTGTCIVTMSAARTVTATFNRDLGVAQSVSSIVFGTVQASQVVTFTNNTGIPMSFLGAASTSARFTQANNCTLVANGASCTATITYNPALTGTDSATLTFTGTASSSPHVVALWAASAHTPRLGNISARLQVLTGSDVMIGGFVIGGTTSKTVVVRGRGPSLIPFGITNALPNPYLELVRSADQSTIATNDDWQQATNAAAVTASGFAPAHPLDSAILVTLPPGAYTAIVSGVAGSTGVGIIEVFEVDRPEVPLANISTRGHVSGGQDAMIGGFVIQGDSPREVVVRARGPSLAPFGIANALANPSLQLVRSSDGLIIAVNDDFGSAANLAQLQATGLAPSNPLESAILITLPPGAYTAVVNGVAGATGVGIVEVFAH